MKPSGTLFVAVGLCLFSPLLFGYCLAFTSPAQSTMNFNATEHKATGSGSPPPKDLIVFDYTQGSQASAFAAIINIGCLMGAFMGAALSDRYGRKAALTLSA